MTGHGKMLYAPIFLFLSFFFLFSFYLNRLFSTSLVVQKRIRSNSHVSPMLTIYIQLSRGRLSKKIVHPTIPNGNIGYDQFTVPDTVAGYFPLALANIHSWPLLPFSQISLKNGELKTTHNTIRDCRVHFFRQSFSKLYNDCTTPFTVYFWSDYATVIQQFLCNPNTDRILSDFFLLTRGLMSKLSNVKKQDPSCLFAFFSSSSFPCQISYHAF